MKETNKLIAEFMGFQKTNIGWYDSEETISFIDGSNTFDEHELAFDDDWRWLMVAVRDCHKVIENYGYDDDTRNFIDDEIFNLDNTLSEFFNDDKEAIYNRVVEFIKFYNNQNK